MMTIRIASAVVLLGLTAACNASDSSAQLTAAHDRYRAGDLDGALQQLEPLLKAGDLDQSSKQRVRELATRVLQLRGEEHFRQARIAESIADFDRQVQLQPDRAAEHWQLGIAYYYASEYEKGARQFELHQTVNPHDVENAAWHFLCMACGPERSVETARKSLIPVTGDARVPMAQIQQMFAGAMAPEEVLRVGEEAGGTAKFYADLYVGLYYEALNRNDESLRLIRIAADNSSAKNNYMRDVARVHLTVRTKKVLRHAVFFKFNASSAKEDVNRVVDAFRELPSEIKDIRELQSGQNITRSGFDDGLTHCFLLTFKDEAGRAEYLSHPAHKAFGAALRPHLDKVFVIDYWGRPQAMRSEKRLKHAVFLKFKDNASDDDVRAVEDELTALPSKIDAIRAFEWGKNNSPETHDEGFTHCFMYTFDSEDGLKGYIAHPAHLAAANELKPKVEKIRVLDFWADDVPPNEAQ